MYNKENKEGTVKGSVDLVKEDGFWKVSKEAWEMKIGFDAQQQTSRGQAGIRRPYEYERIVGSWKGKDAGHSTEDWEFSFGPNFEVTATGPGGQRAYRGEALVVDGLGEEGGSIRVLPGGAPFDVQISDAPSSAYVGKLSLGSFKIEGGPGRPSEQIQLCGGEPGLMKRTSDFASKGGIRCFDLRKISGPPAGAQVPAQTQQPALTQQPSTGSPFSKQDQGVTGEAVIVKDGKTETFPVRTGFFSETRMAQPARATVQFQAVAPEHSNARRIELTFDATKTGFHYAEGRLLSENFMSGDKIRTGERTPQGYTASFSWVNDGGQFFWPKTSCTIIITSAYTGSPSSILTGEIRDCQVHSAGIDYNISSVKFTMRGVPAR